MSNIIQQSQTIDEQTHKLIQELPKLFQENRLIRYAIWDICANKFADKTETDDKFYRLLEEFRKEREESNKRFAEMREESDRKFREMREELAEMREESDRKFREMREELAEMREESDRKFREMREELAEMRKESDRKFKEMREESDRKFKEMREESNKKFAEMREESDRKFKEMREESDQKFKEMREDYDQKFNEVREELAEMRKESDRKFKEMREESDQKFKEMREESDQKFKEMREDYDQKFNQVHEEIKLLAQSIKLVDKRIDRTIGALGARWGLNSEKVFRDAIRDVLFELTNYKVERFLGFDEQGVVFGRPDQIELDVVIKNGQTWVMEIKSSISKADVYIFERKVKFYEQSQGIKVTKRIIISPMIEKSALELAKDLGIEVYSQPEDLTDNYGSQAENL